jgi:hypothetical protein
MNRLKKTLAAFLLLTNVAISANDNYKCSMGKKHKEEQNHERNNSAAVWAGVAGFVGAVAGVAVGSWIVQNQEQEQSSSIIIAQPSSFGCQQELSCKGREIKTKLDRLAKYGHSFELTNDFDSLVINLYKLGYRLYDIDSSFFHQLAQDHKVLSDAGYSIWWNSLTSLEDQKNLYLANSKALISYFNRNQDFITSCQIVNSYVQILEHCSDPLSFIRLNYRNSQEYPVLFYVDKVALDINKLIRLQHKFRLLDQAFIGRLQRTEKKLENLLQILYSSRDYRDELNRKQQVEIFEQYNRLEQEKLEIARKQADALEQANRLTAERNRIEQMRNQFYRDGR